MTNSSGLSPYYALNLPRIGCLTSICNSSNGRYKIKISRTPLALNTLNRGAGRVHVGASESKQSSFCGLPAASLGLSARLREGSGDSGSR